MLKSQSSTGDNKSEFVFLPPGDDPSVSRRNPVDRVGSLGAAGADQSTKWSSVWQPRDLTGRETGNVAVNKPLMG
jgi:hypothetical protein